MSTLVTSFFVMTNVQPVGVVIVALLPPATEIDASKTSLTCIPLGRVINRLAAGELPVFAELDERYAADIPLLV
jgi:hypothetical protein